MNDINSPLVSIGLPIVKCDFLKSAIDCCTAQTYFNIEIVVVNNGKTAEIRNEIKRVVNEVTDNRIRYYENTSQLSIIENWNKTLSLATGEFFAILCDDDYWEPAFIQAMVDLSLKYPSTNVFHSRVMTIDENNSPLDISQVCPEFESCLDFIYNRISGNRIQFLSDFMVRTAVLKSINGFAALPGGWGSDDITWFLMSENGGIVYVNKPLFYYRDSSLSVTNSMNKQIKLDATDKYIGYMTEIVQRQNESDIQTLLLKKKITTELIHLRRSRYYQYTSDLFKSKYNLTGQFLKLAMLIYRIKFKLFNN